MKFIRLLPDTLPLALSLLMGLLLLFAVYLQKGSPVFRQHKDWVAFNLLLTVLLVDKIWRPGFQLTLNFVLPGLFALIWLLRLVDPELFSQERLHQRIYLKLPFLLALVIMTITNHVSELFGFITMCVSFLVIQILTFRKENLSKGLISADIALILTLVLSYNFYELRNIAWFLTLIFQLGMFFHSRDGSKIEA